MGDIHQPATDPNQAVLQRLAALENRLDAMQAVGVRITTGVGAPTHAAADGTFYIRTDATALYARVGGVWKSATLT